MSSPFAACEGGSELFRVDDLMGAILRQVTSFPSRLILRGEWAGNEAELREVRCMWGMHIGGLSVGRRKREDALLRESLRWRHKKDEERLKGKMGASRSGHESPDSLSS